MDDINVGFVFGVVLSLIGAFGVSVIVGAMLDRVDNALATFGVFLTGWIAALVTILALT